jgi:hypothetical protein
MMDALISTLKLTFSLKHIFKTPILVLKMM